MHILLLVKKLCKLLIDGRIQTVCIAENEIGYCRKPYFLTLLAGLAYQDTTARQKSGYGLNEIVSIKPKRLIRSLMHETQSVFMSSFALNVAYNHCNNKFWLLFSIKIPMQNANIRIFYIEELQETRRRGLIRAFIRLIQPTFMLPTCDETNIS